jgi:hypothetical protein
MSVTEILAELPKLDATELELVFERALELQRGTAYAASPELLQAIDEALAIPEDQCVSIEEAYRVVSS